MTIFTDELMYQCIITGAFVFVINTFLLCSCADGMTSNSKEELQLEEEISEEQSDEEVDNNNLEVDNNNLEVDNNNLEEDNNNLEENNNNLEENNILNTEEQNSHVYKGFNLMTKKQLIRFLGKEHTYKNKNELIISAINKFILISIDRLDSIPIFVKNYIKNN
jgi:hypothetical protein